MKDLGVGEVDRLLPLERLRPLAARALTRSTRVVLLDHCARKGVVSGLKRSLDEEACTIGSGRWFVFVVDLDHFGDVGLSMRGVSMPRPSSRRARGMRLLNTHPKISFVGRLLLEPQQGCQLGVIPFV